MALTILVVEDYAPFRRLTCTALQRRVEVQTIEAADGLEAVRKAEELQPDVILLDLNCRGCMDSTSLHRSPGSLPTLDCSS